MTRKWFHTISHFPCPDPAHSPGLRSAGVEWARRRLTLDHRHPTPLHAQLERGIRAAIATGRLAAGDQLPTVRELAVELKVNANTVARVYLDLERAGVLQTRRGIGSFVASGPVPAPRKTGPRDPELRALVQRCLDEAAVRGFSADDVLRQLKQSIAKQGG